MTLNASFRRSISDLGYPVARGVLDTIHLLETRYGATDYHDSGHTKTAPTWIFKLPRHGGAEVGVRMNKRDLTLYMRDKTLDGKRLRDIVPANKVAKVYPRDGQPANSVLNSTFLGPSSQNEVLMLELEPEDIQPVLAAFFGERPGVSSPSADRAVEDGQEAGLPSRDGKQTTAEEDFSALLERQSETGRAGELVVVIDELDRLRQLGCPAPERYVERVATSDVGRGYDIESTWPGEERCIEVKTSTRTGSHFFITANERKVLASLGERAWLYRVFINGDGHGTIAQRLNNPMKHILQEQMTPVVWRVPDAALTAAFTRSDGA